MQNTKEQRLFVCNRCSHVGYSKSYWENKSGQLNRFCNYCGAINSEATEKQRRQFVKQIGLRQKQRRENKLLRFNHGSK